MWLPSGKRVVFSSGRYNTENEAEASALRKAVGFGHDFYEERSKEEDAVNVYYASYASESAKPVETSDPREKFELMTRPVLMELAKAKGIEVTSRTSKGMIINCLLELEGGE